MKKQSNLLVAKERIMRAIIVVRGCRAILDADVASLYGVETRALIQAVKRNADRFPPRGRMKAERMKAEEPLCGHFFILHPSGLHPSDWPAH